MPSGEFATHTRHAQLHPLPATQERAAPQIWYALRTPRAEAIGVVVASLAFVQLAASPGWHHDGTSRIIELIWEGGALVGMEEKRSAALIVAVDAETNL